MVTRHEFLAMLHEKLQPRGYLEIGVHTGDSLRLAKCLAIGIDPAPHLVGHFPGTTQVSRTTSDNYFSAGAPALEHIDLAFIDGMHLFEFALRDFLNIEQYANPRTVVVFDDVLPRNQHEASRTQCPGDWTGDVWKVPSLLSAYRRDLILHWVDTEPTGTAVVYGFGQGGSKVDVFERVESLGLEGWEAVPDDVINRVQAIGPQEALERVTDYLQGMGT
jgi:predicted O-methyltransferase YrrM